MLLYSLRSFIGMSNANLVPRHADIVVLCHSDPDDPVGSRSDNIVDHIANHNLFENNKYCQLVSSNIFTSKLRSGSICMLSLTL